MTHLLDRVLDPHIIGTILALVIVHYAYKHLVGIDIPRSY